jgi:hypothetical protein
MDIEMLSSFGSSAHYRRGVSSIPGFSPLANIHDILNHFTKASLQRLEISSRKYRKTKFSKAFHIWHNKFSTSSSIKN